MYARIAASQLPDRLVGAMSKKKRKKKQRQNEKASDVSVVAQEIAPGIGATALATFARDLSAFGSRAEKPTRGSAR